MYTTDMNAVASTSALAYPATKDAAAKEREDRLLAAKKKLKLYRARTNQRMSATSSLSGSGSSPSTSPTKSIRRRSGLTSSISMPSDLAAAKHAHRRSQSKSGLLAAMGGDTLVAAANTGAHVRRASRSSRMSRNSISFKQAGHGHTRSRASISMSFSGPAAPPPPPVVNSTLEPSVDRPITPTPRAHPSDRANALNTPSSWLHGGANGFPASPDPVSRQSPASNSIFHASPNPSIQGAAGRHGRHGSRHARQSSVSNFRESIDMISGGSVADAALLRPSISSFAEVAPSPAASPFVATHGGWSNDPQQLLAALKERGRRESDDPTRSPEQTRQSALEALEGRLAAPTDMISLGDAEPGEMLSAARSPGKLHAANPMSAAAPHTPALGSISSPMLGLGMASGPAASSVNKRGSWGPGLAQPPFATVAQGVMELGEIAEEDEEDEETRSLRGSIHGDSPRRRGTRARSTTSGSSPQSSISSISRIKTGSPSPRKSRPLSLLAESTPSRPSQLGAVAEEETSREEEAAGRDDSQASPASSRRSSMRPLSLSGFSRPASPSASRPPERATGSPPDIRTSVSPGEKRHVSMFHSAAVSGLNPEPIASAASGQSALPAQQQQQQRGGLRSLSMGSPTITPERRFSGRPASLIAASPLNKGASPSPTTKRSSISYRTDSATPEGQQRAWRNSLAQHSTQSSISPAVSTKTYSSFPFGVSGGFGDLEVDGDGDGDDRGDECWARSESPSHSREMSAAAGLAGVQEELTTLRNKLADLDLRNSQLETTHAAEVAELERKASDAAAEMRTRIAELEQQLESERSGRRFEVEGLKREVEMTKETIEDLVGERDALREDVEGWRSRCTGLEAQVKKEREDDALAQAQAKLIGEMRDQIYTLVAALERERGEHAETRKEVERILEDRVREAAADVQHQQQHQHRGGPSVGASSISSTSSHSHFPSAIKYASPPPGAPATLKQPRPDELALVMEMEEVEDDDDDEDEEEQQRNNRDALAPHGPYNQEAAAEGGAASNVPRHGAMTASNGSMMSTLSSSFGHHSYSGNTTEDTSLTTDVEDSYSARYSSPPSGPPSFANSPFPPSAARSRDSDVVAVALGQLDTLAEEEEEEVDGSAAFDANMSAASQTTPIADNSAAAARDSLDSTTDQTTSASSDALPTTPDRTTAPEQHHRSRSFVRQWSFPKGSVSSSRPSFEDEDRSFFGYNKHDSLPPLPISEHILPPFLSSTLDIEDAAVSFLPAPPVEGTVETANHVRRPSSPRPLERMSNSHARRLSAQHRPPPPSPSALVTAALHHQQPALPQHGYYPSQGAATGSLDPSPVKSRYSFGALIGTIGGAWSPTSAAAAAAGSAQPHPPPPPPPPRASLSGASYGSTPSKASHMSISAGPLVVAEDDEDEGVEEDVYVSSHAPAASAGYARPPPPPHPPQGGSMPPQLQHQGRRLRPIARHEVPMPRAARLSKLDFTKSACCMDQPVFVV